MCIYRVLILYFYLILLDLIFISKTNCHQFPKLSFIVVFYFIYVHNLCFCIVISMLRMNDIKVLEFNLVLYIFCWDILRPYIFFQGLRIEINNIFLSLKLHHAFVRRYFTLTLHSTTDNIENCFSFSTTRWTDNISLLSFNKCWLMQKCFSFVSDHVS